MGFKFGRQDALPARSLGVNYPGNLYQPEDLLKALRQPFPHRLQEVTDVMLADSQQGSLGARS